MSERGYYIASYIMSFIIEIECLFDDIAMQRVQPTFGAPLQQIL